MRHEDEAAKTAVRVATRIAFTCMSRFSPSFRNGAIWKTDEAARDSARGDELTVPARERASMRPTASMLSLLEA